MRRRRVVRRTIAVARDALASFIAERAAAGDPLDVAPVATTTRLLQGPGRPRTHVPSPGAS